MGLEESLNDITCVPSLHLPTPGTHRVVSWLMLVKEESLKELILLLLKSLEKTKASLLTGKKNPVLALCYRLLPSPTLPMPPAP